MVSTSTAGAAAPTVPDAAAGEVSEPAVVSSDPAIEQHDAQAAQAVQAAPSQGVMPVGTGPAGVVTDEQIFGLLNYVVDALMADGNHIEGQLIGYDPNYVILEDTATHQRYQLDRRVISGVRMIAVPAPVFEAEVAESMGPYANFGVGEPPPEYQRKHSSLVTGAVLSGAGTLMMATTVFLLASYGFHESTVVMGIGSGVALGVGLPLLFTGIHAHKRNRRWQSGQAAHWAPSLRVDRRGFDAGMQVRF